MNYENFISYRYLTASKGRFLSFLNFISVAGVALGVMALIVVTGVMTGFGNNLREKIIGTTPHIIVQKETGIVDYEKIVEKLKSFPGVVGAAPFIQGNIFIENNGQGSGIAVRGIDPQAEKEVTKIKEYLKSGNIEDLASGGVIIGKEMASYYGYAIGDDVVLIAPGSGIAGHNWKYTLKVVGIFDTGMIDYDLNLVLVSIKKAQEILDIPAEKVSGVGARLKDPYDAKKIKKEIYHDLGYSYIVRTWVDINRNLFEALFLEKWGLFIILTLMVLVASFNIVSTLVVTVSSKIHDIGILQSIGVTRKSIRHIFTKQGIFIGMMGTFWGVVSGVSISYILRTYVRVPADIYSIDHVPVQLQLSDMLIIIAAAMVISYLAAIYPAAKAAELQPVEALRYE